MELTVIIPTYNEKENIVPLIQKLVEVSKIDNLTLRIIVVDDNSPDKTGEVVENLKSKVSGLEVIHRSQKDGLGKAYLEGFKSALSSGADLIITMDADLSHKPEDITRFLANTKGFDIVIGSRYIKGGKMEGFDFFRKLLSKWAIFFARFLLGLKTRDLTSGYRCYSRRFIEFLNGNGIDASGYAFQVEMIKKAEKNGFKIFEIPIIFRPRKLGKSKLSWGEVLNSAWALLKLKWSKN